MPHVLPSTAVLPRMSQSASLSTSPISPPSTISSSAPFLTVRALFGRRDDDAPADFDDYWWSDLTEYAQKQATLMGYDEKSWNDDDDDGDDDETEDLPEPMKLEWAELSPQQQQAKKYFGWTKDDKSTECLRRIRRASSKFVPQRGLVGENQEFWNTLGGIEGRDILIQNAESYEVLMKSRQFAPLMRKYYQQQEQQQATDDVPDLDVTDKPLPEHPYYHHPTFGEQVIVEGLDSTRICVGDVFEAPNGGLKIQVSSPRMACSYIDKKHNSVFGLKGIRKYSSVEGHAGWFVRVLREGKLSDGDTLHRVERVNPKWTLAVTAQSMFGEGKALAALSGKVDWKRSIEELEELVNLPELAEYEWKEPARVALQSMLKSKQHHKGLEVGQHNSQPAVLVFAFQLEFLGAMWNLFLQFLWPGLATTQT